MVSVLILEDMSCKQETSSNPERCCIYMVCNETCLVRKQQKHSHNIKQAPNSPVKLPLEELENSIRGFNGNPNKRF